MANRPFDENQIEELLQSMPKINDNRKSDEIYRSVHLKLDKQQKNKKLFLIPALSVLAAAILFVLVTPLFLHEGQQQSKSMNMSRGQDIAHKSASKVAGKADKADKAEKSEKVNLFTESAKDQISKTAVYPEDLAGKSVFTYSIFTEDAVVVPVSILANKDKADWAEQYKENVSAITKTLPMAENFLPSNVEMKYNAAEKKIHVIIPKTSLPSISEQVQLNFDRIVQYSFVYQDINKVDITDENGNQIELGQIGKVKENFIINKTPRNAFYLYKSSNGDEYLLPTDETFPNLQAALKAMKIKPDDFHQPVMNMDLNVKETTSEQATIEFTNKIQLEEEKNPMQMLEAILLTAKNFGYQYVQFENIEPLQWDGFDLSKPVEVPIAPNRINVK
ncbi:hypothetical protein [Bacillus sp. FJAT-49736]|uniref:hypothetical protein n=1 Tax=Bacillus sp. FJAT-49736 TaxID=2833582 RepID=UPI001BC9D290|nr:hypothetical protein [Bacillus sp. FJAT-49736]MBS4173316.1 hypothetical protein [Bacillus sp. FJAT-49736]